MNEKTRDSVLTSFPGIPSCLGPDEIAVEIRLTPCFLQIHEAVGNNYSMLLKITKPGIQREKY